VTGEVWLQKKAKFMRESPGGPRSDSIGRTSAQATKGSSSCPGLVRRASGLEERGPKRVIGFLCIKREKPLEKGWEEEGGYEKKPYRTKKKEQNLDTDQLGIKGKGAPLERVKTLPWN